MTYCSHIKAFLYVLQAVAEISLFQKCPVISGNAKSTAENPELPRHLQKLQAFPEMPRQLRKFIISSYIFSEMSNSGKQQNFEVLTL